MKLKKFMGIIAAVSIIASAGSVGASAAEELPIGYVTVSVEKFTLGQRDSYLSLSKCLILKVKQVRI